MTLSKIALAKTPLMRVRQRVLPLGVRGLNRQTEPLFTERRIIDPVRFTGVLDFDSRFVFLEFDSHTFVAQCTFHSPSFVWTDYQHFCSLISED